MILLDRRQFCQCRAYENAATAKIDRDLARIANLVQLIPAPSLPMLQELLPSAVF